VKGIKSIKINFNVLKNHSKMNIKTEDFLTIFRELFKNKGIILS